MHGSCPRCLPSVNPEARKAGHPCYVRNKSYKRCGKSINRFSGIAAPFKTKSTKFPFANVRFLNWICKIVCSVEVDGFVTYSADEIT